MLSIRFILDDLGVDTNINTCVSCFWPGQFEWLRKSLAASDFESQHFMNIQARGPSFVYSLYTY